jgi:hypothetical protein
MTKPAKRSKSAPKRAPKRAPSKAAAAPRKRALAPAKAPKKPIRKKAAARVTPPTPDERRASAARASAATNERRAIAELRALAAARNASLDELLALVARVAEQIPASVAPADVFAIALDSQSSEFRFAQSANVAMRRWQGTERDLFEQAVRKIGSAPANFIREAVALYARRTLAITTSTPPPPGIARRGRQGVNDPAFDDAYEVLVAHGRPVTPSLLCEQAKLPGRYRAAALWATGKGVTFDTDARRKRTTAASNEPAASNAPAGAPDATTTAARSSSDSPASAPTAPAPANAHPDAVEGVIYHTNDAAAESAAAVTTAAVTAEPSAK